VHTARHPGVGWRSKARQVYNRLQRALCGLLWWERTYHEDGLATEHNCDFVRDARFARAYELGRATGSFRTRDLRWRVHVACWAASHAVQLEGDLVECGVYRGGLARAIVDYVGFGALDKHFYLFDTFSGIPDQAISPAERALGRSSSEFDECYAAVCETFRPFPNVHPIRGIVPDSLPQAPIERVAYLSLDMNVYQPEIAAAEYFWPRMSSGGIILLDDYGFRRYIMEKYAFDEFAARKGVPILSLPTGQGLILVP
jgi:O-methyltransferase